MTESEIVAALPASIREPGWELTLTHTGHDGSHAYNYHHPDEGVLTNPWAVFVTSDGSIDVEAYPFALARLDGMVRAAARN